MPGAPGGNIVHHQQLYATPWFLKQWVAAYSKALGFEVLTAVAMKSSVFWDISPYIPVKVNRRFGGTYHLHLQSKSKQNKQPA
jgi:hypothetical protein